MGKPNKQDGGKNSSKKTQAEKKAAAAAAAAKKAAKVVRVVRHHGDPGVPDYRVAADRIASERRAAAGATEYGIEGGILELSKLSKNHAGSGKFFEVADDEGNRAIFRAWQNVIEVTHDDGKKEMISYVAICLHQKPTSECHPLHSVPFSALGISVSQGQMRKGKEHLTRPDRMDDRDFSHKTTIWSFLHGAYEGAVKKEEEAAAQVAKNRREQLEGIRRVQELRKQQRQNSLDALVDFAVNGGKKVFGVDGNNGFIVVSCFPFSDGKLVAQAVKVGGKLSDETKEAIQRLIDNKIRLQLRLVVAGNIPSILPEVLRPYEAGLTALRAHLRAAFEKAGMIEKLDASIEAAMKAATVNKKTPPESKKVETNVVEGPDIDTSSAKAPQYRQPGPQHFEAAATV